MNIKKDVQLKYKFDKKTSVKILKGTLIAGTGGAALFALNIIKNTGVGSLEPIIVILIPALINLIKEWMQGEK